MSDQEIIQAFHLMWDDFPEPVMITQKSREIVALNKKAESFGLKIGIKCSSIGKPEDHKGCLLNRAVDEKRAKIPSRKKFMFVRFAATNMKAI